ncbi:VOC family protein, partial [Micromonospora deserti]
PEEVVPAGEHVAPPNPAEEHATADQFPGRAATADPAGEQVAAADPAGERPEPPAPGDPFDPLDLPLDDPAPAGDRAAAEAVTSRELDEAIFGPRPTAGPGLDAADELGAPIAGVGLTLLVTDLPRSLGFYRDLGFTEIDRGAGNAVLASGATRLVLREVTEAAPISRRLVHVNLEVDDIDSAYERLRDSGVRFTYAPRVVNRGTRLEVRAAAFRDPDGHGIALTQWRERADA